VIGLNLANEADRRRYIQAQADGPLEHLPPADLVTVFLCLLIEARLSFARRVLDEITERPRDLMVKTIAGMRLNPVLVALCRLLPSPRTHRGGSVWSMYDQFLDRLLPEYRSCVDETPRLPPRCGPRHFEYASGPKAGVLVDGFLRKRWAGPESRPHELGGRVRTGFTKGGWVARNFDVSLEDLRTAVGSLSSGTARMCIVDAQARLFKGEGENAELFLAAARRSYDVIVALLLDAWMPWVPSHVARLAPWLDFIWSMAPSVLQQLRGCRACGEICFPLPLGIDRNLLRLIRDGESNAQGLVFVGAIEAVNFSRLFWMTRLAQFPAVRFDLSSHADTERPADAEYERYLRRLAACRFNLNFARRLDGTMSITGRCFEVPAVGRTLVQEQAEDLWMYLEPNTHYLEFANYEGLVDILDSIASGPEKARAVGAEGTKYWDAFYSDEMLVRHFSHLLFS
jgi:hypothetical protein